MAADTITLIVLAVAIVLFVTELIPLSITAMSISVVFALTGVLSPAEAFAGFVDSNVLLFMGMFVIGAGIFETGMAKQIGSLVVRYAKTERQLIVALMLVAGIMSGFLSNTGTAAVLIPVVVGIAQRSGFSRARLLLPLAIAAAMGGNLSLIGSPGNMIAQSNLEKVGASFRFFEYGYVGLPILLAGIAFFALLGHQFLPKTNPALEIGNSVFDRESDYADVPAWKKNLSLIILLAAIAAMMFEKQLGIKLFVSAWAGAMLLVICKVIDEKTAIAAIDMKTILLFVGSLSLAAALKKTGAGELIARNVVAFMGEKPSPFIIVATILLISSILTNFMSNTATTSLLVPIALSIAAQIQADPRAVLMATVIGGSMAYATPIGQPANAMIYTLGNYRFKDYVKAGLPVLIISLIIAALLLPLIFPFFPK